MWLCCANPILPKHPRRVHSLFLAIVGYTKRLVIAQSARSRSSRSGPEIRELGLHFVEGLVLRGDGFRLLFWQGFGRGGGAGKDFLQLRGFSQKFLCLGALQPNLDPLASLRRPRGVLLERIAQSR